MLGFHLLFLWDTSHFAIFLVWYSMANALVSFTCWLNWILCLFYLHKKRSPESLGSVTPPLPWESDEFLQPVLPNDGLLQYGMELNLFLFYYSTLNVKSVSLIQKYCTCICCINIMYNSCKHCRFWWWFWCRSWQGHAWKKPVKRQQWEWR